MPSKEPNQHAASGKSLEAKDATSRARAEWLARLFPDDVPQLWCPTLTHFLDDGEIDAERIRRHLRFLSPHVKGVLVPGSTGEGWEMNDGDVRRLLPIVLETVGRTGGSVMLGVLKESIDDMLRSIADTLVWLKEQSATDTANHALAACGVVGFAVCPPKGAELSQEAIGDGLADVLTLGLPTALYQLPQVTENEMAPETVAHLASRFSNLLYFKDTSGRDLVAESGLDFGGVYFVRGAEGDYARVTRSAGGVYDGFLLSTANVFAAQFAEILRLLRHGEKAAAESLAGRVEQVVRRTFALVSDFEAGNPFTNANKALDHVMAYGPAARDAQPPRLYSGLRLPDRFIDRAVEFLTDAALLPTTGYLHEAEQE